jgi:hypothetical protein
MSAVSSSTRAGAGIAQHPMPRLQRHLPPQESGGPEHHIGGPFGLAYSPVVTRLVVLEKAGMHGINCPANPSSNCACARSSESCSPVASESKSSCLALSSSLAFRTRTPEDPKTRREWRQRLLEDHPPLDEWSKTANSNNR